MYTSGGTNVSSTMTYKGPLSNGVAIDCRNVDTGHWAPKAVAFVDSTPTGTKPGLSRKDAIIYEAHVKGLTAPSLERQPDHPPERLLGLPGRGERARTTSAAPTPAPPTWPAT